MRSLIPNLCRLPKTEFPTGIKKTILEQQKFLEFIGKDRTKNNIFISVVPNEMTTDGDVENNYANILQSVLNVTTPGIDTTTYRILKNFESKDEAITHSIKIQVHDLNVKTRILKGCVEFKKLPAEHPLKKVYLKNDDPPLTRKENERLHRKVWKLRALEVDPGNPKNTYKIKKGKLYKTDAVIDEFNLSNTVFFGSAL